MLQTIAPILAEYSSSVEKYTCGCKHMATDKDAVTVREAGKFLRWYCSENLVSLRTFLKLHFSVYNSFPTVTVPDCRKLNPYFVEDCRARLGWCTVWGMDQSGTDTDCGRSGQLLINLCFEHERLITSVDALRVESRELRLERARGGR